MQHVCAEGMRSLEGVVISSHNPVDKYMYGTAGLTGMMFGLRIKVYAQTPLRIGRTL